MIDPKTFNCLILELESLKDGTNDLSVYLGREDRIKHALWQIRIAKNED